MAPKPPVVTVIIPTFNRATDLERAVDSVQNQSLVNWELIIVDDGSTDGTDRLVNSYASSDERIRNVAHELNQGVSAARNTGIELATGEFVSFLDSDDEWDSNKLAAQVEFLSRHLDLAGCLTGVLWKDGEGSHETCPPSLEPEEMADAMVSRRLTSFGSGSCLMVRTTAIETHTIRFEEDWQAFEDWDFTTQVALAGGVGVVESVLVTVHRTNSGTQRQWSPVNVIRTAPLLMSKYEREFRARGHTRAKVHTQVAIGHQRLGDYNNARHSWRMAWSSSPRHMGFLKNYLVASIKSLRHDSSTAGKPKPS